MEVPTWKPPDWWAPLRVLPGYRDLDYTGSANTIKVACAGRGTNPSTVIIDFVDFFPKGMILYRWKDPVRALVNTLDIQIGKVKGSYGKSWQGVPDYDAEAARVRAAKARASHRRLLPEVPEPPA